MVKMSRQELIAFCNNITVPLSQHGAIKLETVFQPGPCFTDDQSWFIAHPGCRLRIRRAVWSEFDTANEAYREAWELIPPLYVKVDQHFPDFHGIEPIFRGEIDFVEPQTQAEACRMLISFYNQDGLDTLTTEHFFQYELPEMARDFAGVGSKRKGRRLVH